MPEAATRAAGPAPRSHSDPPALVVESAARDVDRRRRVRVCARQHQLAAVADAARRRALTEQRQRRITGVSRSRYFKLFEKTPGRPERQPGCHVRATAYGDRVPPRHGDASLRRRSRHAVRPVVGYVLEALPRARPRGITGRRDGPRLQAPRAPTQRGTETPTPQRAAATFPLLSEICGRRSRRSTPTL